MKPIVIFGAAMLAELAHFYFTRDTQRTIAAFTVDSSHLEESTFYKLPVVPFDNIEKIFPPDRYDMFVPKGYAQGRSVAKSTLVRKEKFLAAKNKGYYLPSYISSKAIVMSPELVGQNCFIMEGNCIQPFVRIGNNVIMFAANAIGHHAVVEDHVFIAGRAAIAAMTNIGEGTFIGIGTVLRNGITVGKNSFLGVGSVVTVNVKEEEVYTAATPALRKIKSSKMPTI